MITWIFRKKYYTYDTNQKPNKVIRELSYCEGRCKSTDVKPIEGICNGSILLEIDTGKVYMFDGETSEWCLWG